MNPQQQMLGLDLPSPPAAMPVRVRVREVPPAAPAAAAEARELWAAVQLGPDAADAGELAALARRAQSFTPRVATESTDAVLLELAGSRRLFGGLPALLAALRAAFPRPLQLALAPTPLAAVLLARARRNCCITSEARLAGRLAPLAMCHLHWPEEETARLASMGVATLGELLRLPRAGLARRIGAGRLRQLDQLTGARADPRAALAQPEGFRERIDPDWETTDRERLLAALLPTLARLEDFLRARQRGVMAVRITLHHRRVAPLHCLVRCVVPEYRAARFAALLTARLEALQLVQPVRRLEFTAGRLRRFTADSGMLWQPGEHGSGGAAAAAPEFLQTLLARLGEEAVYGLAVVDEHRPERQYHARSLAQSPPPGSVGPHVTATMAGGAVRPLGLMPSPLPLEMHRDRDGRVLGLRHAGQELTLVTGPERIESGWWDGAPVARDYYVARAAGGARWWIFRECATPRRWFVHGCFA